MRENSPLSRSVLVLFFFSGFSALIYEVVWARMLGLVFGTTAYAWATVLAAYMGGMALGAVFGGRIADGSSRPLRLFALCEAGVGLFGVSSPAILHLVQHLFLTVHPFLPASAVTQTSLRVILCAGALAVPTMLMGATLPLVARGILAGNRPVGRDLGTIYSANTFGACAGALLTGFALLPMLGMSASLFSAAGINCIVAAFAILLFGNHRSENQANINGLENPKLSVERHSMPPWLLPSVLGISGFCAMAYEVLWGRALVFFLTSTTYAFTSMLSMVLLGLALGGIAASMIARKEGCQVAWIAALQLCIGLLGFASPWMLQHIDPFVHFAESHLARSWLQWITVRYAVCFGAIFPMALCMGATFPLVTGMAVRSLKTAGKSIGFLSFLNTIGGIAGSLFAAFLLVPIAGVQRSFVIVASANCVAGLALHAFDKRRSWKWAAPVAGLAASLFVFSIIFIGNNPMVLYSRVVLGAQRPTEVLSSKEDQIASVAVLKTDRGLNLNIDGFNAAGTYGYEYMHLLGHLPMLLSPSPDTALVICLGTGTTCGAVGLYPSVKRVDCVEISPAVISSAHVFSSVNNNAPGNPKIHIIQDDGRNHLLSSSRTYDVITLEPMHPHLSSATNLYSADFYKLCRKRLSPHGVMAQWAPLHVLSPREYKMLVKSFASVFPHASLWFLGTEGVLIGTMDPLRIDIGALKKRMAEKGIQHDLVKTGLFNPGRLLSCFLMDERAIEAYVKNVPIMTDDRPFIEFSAPRNLILPVNRMWMQNLEELLRRRVPILPFIENADDSTVGSINRCALASSLFMNAALFNAQNDFFQACVAVDSALGLMPGDTTAKMLKADAGENALTLCLNRARTCRQKGVFPCAEQAYLRALAVDSLCAVARTELTTLYNSAGMFEKGLEQALKAAASLPNDPATHTNLAVVYMNLNRPAEAESSLVRAIAVDKTYERAHFFLGQLYKETGKIKNPDASEHF